jgi:hypothetical protein
MFIGIIKWGNYLIKTKECKKGKKGKKSKKSKEGFDRYTSIITDMGTADTSHTVDLPINTTFSCQNMCGPLARCSITGEQCTSDIDCYGCQPDFVETSNNTRDIRGQNDAGKLTNGYNIRYSILTTDIGTQAKLYNKGINLQPPSYFKGVNQWSKSFKAGMELYDKKYNPSIEILPFLPQYPNRKTLSGEFNDNGPLAANAYL